MGQFKDIEDTPMPSKWTWQMIEFKQIKVDWKIICFYSLLAKWRSSAACSVPYLSRPAIKQFDDTGSPILLIFNIYRTTPTHSAQISLFSCALSVRAIFTHLIDPKSELLTPHHHRLACLLLLPQSVLYCPVLWQDIIYWFVTRTRLLISDVLSANRQPPSRERVVIAPILAETHRRAVIGLCGDV